MSLFIFSTLIISISFLTILGSWYSIQGPFLQHLVMLISVAVAIFSAAIVIAIQPLLSSRKSRLQHALPHEAAWGNELSTVLTTPAAVLDGFVVKFVNTPFLQALGMVGMADQVLGMPFTNLIHPADHTNFAELSVEASTGKTKNEATKIRMVCSDGSTLPANSSLTRLREDRRNNLMLFQFTPITTVNTLNNNYEPQFNYHSIIEKLEEIVFQLNAEGKIIFLNSAWESLLELKTQDCLGKPITAYAHPEDKPMLEARLDSLTQGKRTNCTIETRLLTVRGDPTWVILRAKTTAATTWERTSVIGTMIDNQQNKEAEAGIIANRRAANALLAHVPGMVYRCRNDRSWNFEFVNEGCIDVTGYDSLELINNPNITFNHIIHPDDREAVWESVNQQINCGEKFKLIYRIITRKGETKLVQENGRGIFSSTGELLALEGFITEIPDQRYNVTSPYSQNSGNNSTK
ncbi:putative diguanylate cyclase [mine drainage metagenome]|uniref:histidine kinase n=1 Tax=mine drainage metagenome TaxID=410659 RepID=A0A1J5RXK7_9ZZZZ